MQDLQHYSQSDVQQLEQIIPLEDLLQGINYQVDKIQRAPEKWKCFCPIHKETIFRSLTIQVAKRTFQCGFRQCPGHRGGSLLDLYRLACGKSETETIEFWAKRLKFPIQRKRLADEEIPESLEMPTVEAPPETGVDYDDEALVENIVESEIAEERLPAAPARTVGQEADIQEPDFDLESLDFDLAEEEETEAPPLEVEQEAPAVETAVSSAPPATVPPPPPPSIEQYGFEISPLLADGQLDRAEDLLNEAFERYPAHPELLHIRVRLLEKRGDKKAAVEELNRLLEIYRVQHLPEGCLRVAHQILALEPNNANAMDALAEAHLARHETSQAVRFLQAAARVCLEREQPEEALQRLNRVLKICPPGSPEESRTQEERIQILALLDRVPEAVQAQIELARILIRKELVGKAGEVLEKTIEIDPGCREAHQMLVDLYLARGMQQQAIAQMQRLAEQYLTAEPGRETETAGPGVEKAIETYRRVLDIDPGQTETRNRLALLYKHGGRQQEANEEYFAIARIYREKELLGRAVRIYENILKQDPRCERAHRALVEVLLEKGDESGAARRWSRFAEACREAEQYEEAIAAAREAIALDPASEELHRALIDVLLQTQQSQPALDASHQLLRLLEAQADTEKVKQCCEAILRIQPDDAEAASRLKKLEREETPARFEIGQPGSVQALITRATALRSETKFLEAIELLKSALQIEAGNDQLWQDLAETLLLAGQPDQAAETWLRFAERLDSEGRNAQALKALRLAADHFAKIQSPGRLDLLRAQARLEIECDLPGEALRSCRVIVELEPGSAEDWAMLARLAEAQDEEAQARQAYEKAGELAANAHKYSAAVQSVRRALDLTPEDTRLRLWLARLLEQLGENAEAASQRLRAAEILAATGSEEAAAQAIEPVFKYAPQDIRSLEQWFELTCPRPEALQQRIERALELASLYKIQGLAGKAEQHLERLHRALPEEVRVIQAQIDLYRETGAVQKAVARLLALADTHRAQEAFEAALGCLQAARDLAPEQEQVLRSLLDFHRERQDRDAQSAILQNLAELASSRGLVGKQIAYLEEAWELTPSHCPFGESLADIHLARGDEASAIEAWRRIAQCHRLEKRTEALQSVYERILAIQPSLARDRFELAQLLLERDPAAAGEHYDFIARQFADQLPPADPELFPVLEQTYQQLIELRGELKHQCGLGDLYRAINDYPAAGCAYYEALENCPEDQPEQAIEICRRILQIAPGEGVIERRLADLYRRQGRTREAADLLRSLWNRYWQNWKAAGSEAIPEGAMVDRIVQSAQLLLELQPEDDAVHRQMAEFYRSIGKPKESAAHWITLGELFTERGDKNRATQTYRQILELQPELLEVRVRLAEVLESQGQVDEAREQYLLLGKAYREQEQWPSAQSCYLRAADMAPNRTEALMALADIAQERDEPQEAVKYLLRLAELGDRPLERLKVGVELNPGDTAIQERYLQALIQADRAEEAVTQLAQLTEQYARQRQYDLALGLTDRVKERFPGYLTLYSITIDLLEKQIQSAKKENAPALAIDRLNHRANAERLACAEMLGAESRNDEAAQLLSKIVQTDLENDRARRQMLQILEGRTEKSAADKKLEISLWQQLGDIYSRRGQLDEAQEAYTRAAELSPRSRSIRQKLATLSAERGSVEDSVAQQRQLAQQAIDEEDWTRAIGALEEILKYQPGDEETLRRLADSYLKINDDSRAGQTAELLLLSAERRLESESVLHWADFILQIDPGRSDILQKRIGALLNSGRLEEAADLLWRLAGQSREQNEVGAEQSACLRLLELGLDRFELNRRAAERLFDLGLETRARSELERLARLSLKQDRPKAAIEIYRILLEHAPEETEYGLALAECYTRADQHAKSLEQRLALDNLFARQERSVERVANLKAALQLAPGQARLHGMLGEVFTNLGNFREAVDCLMKAAELAEAEQDRLHAAEYYRAILAIDSSHLESLRRLNRLQTGCALDAAEKKELMEVRRQLLLHLSRLGTDALPEIDRLAGTLEADYPGNASVLRMLTEAYRVLQPVRGISLGLQLLAAHVQRKEWSEAERTLERIRQMGALEMEQLQTLVRTVEDSPLHDRVLTERARLAELLAQQQDREGAIAHYQALVDAGADPIHFRQALIDNLDIAGHHARSRRHKLELAALFREQGRLRDAIARVESALEYEKNDPECLRQLAALLREANSLQEVRPVLKRLADLAEEQGNLEEAQEHLKASIHCFPRDGELLESLARLQRLRGLDAQAFTTQIEAARAYSESGLVEQSIALYEDATNREPQRIDIQEELIALLEQKGMRKEALERRRESIEWRLRQGREEEALQCYEALVARDPQDLTLLQEMADFLLRLQRTDRAVEVLFRLAEVYRLREMLKRSQEVLQHILCLNPRHEQARHRLADIYIEKGQEAEGQEELLQLARAIQAGEIAKENPEREIELLGERILDLDPDREEAAVALAELLHPLRQKEPGQAASLWSRVHFSLARRYLARGEAEPAAKSMRQIELADPEHPELPALRDRLHRLERFQIPQEEFQENLQKAEQHWEHGEYGAAALLYEQLLKSQPRSLEIVLRLAESHSKQNQRPKAIELLENRGHLFLTERNLDAARQCFHQVLHLEPGRFAVHRALADLALAEGRPEAAAEHYVHLADLIESPKDLPLLVSALEKAKEIAPEHEEIHRRLAAAYRKSGHWDAALDTCLSLAEHALRQDHLEAAADALKEALSLENVPRSAPTESAQRSSLLKIVQVRRRLAEILTRQGSPLLAADLLLTAGQSAREGGEFETAQTCFEKILDYPEGTLEPALIAQAFQGLADGFEQSGKAERAAAALIRLAEHHTLHERPREAIEALERAHAIAPRQRQALELLCQAYQKADREEESIRASLRLALLLIERDLMGRAEALYRGLLALPRWQDPGVPPDRGDPSYASVIAALIDLCLDKGSVSEAVELLSDLARRFQDSGNGEQALANWRRILKIQSDHTETLEQIAAHYARQHRTGEALDTYQRLAALNESRGYSQKALGYYFEMLNLAADSKAALDGLERLAQIPGLTALVMEGLKDRFEKDFKKQYAPSVQALGKLLIRLDATAADVRARLPEAFLWEGQSEKAVEQLERLGDRYVREQDLARARQCYQRALEIDPHRRDIEEKLRDSDRRINQEAESEQRQAFRLKIEKFIEGPDPQRALEEIESLRYQDHANAALAEWCADLLEKAAQGLPPFEPQAKSGQQKSASHKALQIRMHLAEVARQEGENEKALNQLDRILALQPDHEQAGRALLKVLESLGRTQRLVENGQKIAERYRLQGQYAAAVEIYRQLEPYASDSPALWGELGATLGKLNLKDDAANAYRRQAERFLEQELYSQALSACNEILLLFPEDLETLHRMVEIYILRGDVRGALTQCRRILDYHLARHDEGSAETVLQRMIELDPAQPSLRREKVELLRRQGKREPLIQELQTLADFYRQNELMNKAIEVWREMLRIEPDHRQAHRQLIDSYLQRGQASEAAAQYLELAEAWQSRDRAFAGDCFQQAIELEPDNPWLIRAYAEHLNQLGQKKECLAQLNRLAEVLHHQGDRDAAAATRERILRMDPEYPGQLERLADLYSEMNQPAKATPLLERWARQLEQAGNVDRAVDVYLRAAQYLIETATG